MIIYLKVSIIMLSEVSQAVRHQHPTLSLTGGLHKTDTMNFFAEERLLHRLGKT